MASNFVQIKQQEMDDFFEVGENGSPTGELGFYRISLVGTTELVYAKRVRPDISLRVYSTIQNGVSREKGADAVRVILFWRGDRNSEPRLIGSERKLLRVKGWEDRLRLRIQNWTEMLGSPCDKCGAHTVLRIKDKKKFFGCIHYPKCRGYGRKVHDPK